MVNFVLPVGFGLGRMEELSETGDTDVFALRIGSEYAQLSALDYDLWWQCRLASKPGQLLEWSRSQGIKNSATRIEFLLRRGILVAIGPGNISDFATRYRMVSCGFGGGVSETGYTILSQTMEPLLEVDVATYLAWSAGDGYATITETANYIAESTGTTIKVALDHTMTGLPEIMAVGAAYLDLARGVRT